MVALSEHRRIRSGGRRLAMKTSVVYPEVDSVVVETKEYYSLCRDVAILPKVKASALVLYRLSGFTELLALKERVLVQGGQVLQKGVGFPQSGLRIAWRINNSFDAQDGLLNRL